MSLLFPDGRRRGASPSEASPGTYFTDGTRLLHVHELARGGHSGAIVEDCRTLEVSFTSSAELDRMSLRPVTSTRH